MAEKTYRDDEIRPCDCCGKHIVETALPIFLTGTIETGGLDKAALMERVGLALQMNSVALASVFASKPAGKRIDTEQFFICHACALEVPMAAVLQMAGEKREAREAKSA